MQEKQVKLPAIQQWVVFLILFATTMVALATIIKQAALFLWVVALLAMSLALILALQQQPRSWWVVLISCVLGFFLFWLIGRSV